MKQSWTARTRMVRSERGFTLVELLATIVILGIIAAIAVPSVGKLIDNSKKDAHVANAEQIIEAARLYVLSEGDNNGGSYSVNKLHQDGYLESIPKVPGEDDKYATNSKVDVTKENENLVYSITLKTNNGGNVFKGGAVKEDELDRDKVK